MSYPRASALLAFLALLASSPPAMSANCTEFLAGPGCTITLAPLAGNSGPSAPSAKFVTAEPAEPAFRIGDEFPIYDHNMLIDPVRYGLPRVDGNWRYYLVDSVVYRVDSSDRSVIAVVQGGNQVLR